LSTLFLDFETRSEANLKKVGPWAYSEHPSTEVICACWAVGKSKVARWGNPAVGYAGWPEASAEALVGLVRDTDLPIEAHNVAFEISIWENVCHKRMGWPRIPIERWRDTMALASYYSLPPALDNLCRVLGLAGKVREGANLIQRYSKLNLKHAQRTIPPEDLKLWLDYCANDVDQERQAAFLLGELPEEEEKVFLHDLAVGMRGLRLDPAGVEGARRVVEQRAGELEAEFNRLTGLNPGQRDRVLEWFEGRGLKLPDLTAETLDDLLDEGKLNSEPIVLAPELRRPLEIRRSHSKASTKKLDAMLAQVGTDGCARFQTRYHGAVTGRNTGTGFQPLNLNRGYGNVSPEQLVRDIGVGDARWLDAVYGDAMEAVGKASRHWITARPGSRIMSGDYTSVEAVVLACLAGEEWKIQAFRDNQPIYEMGACSIYGWPAERAFDPDFKKKWGTERQDGKVRELACGYQGALGAWRNFDNSDRHSD
jgi:DNA polymerase